GSGLKALQRSTLFPGAFNYIPSSKPYRLRRRPFFPVHPPISGTVNFPADSLPPRMNSAKEQPGKSPVKLVTLDNAHKLVILVNQEVVCKCKH
ncbi:hypothetical protein AKJ16_DCAP02837, partial [Drosera capensis]